MKCPSCGKEIDSAYSWFCPSCGAPMHESRTAGHAANGEPAEDDEHAAGAASTAGAASAAGAAGAGSPSEKTQVLDAADAGSATKAHDAERVDAGSASSETVKIADAPLGDAAKTSVLDPLEAPGPLKTDAGLDVFVGDAAGKTSNTQAAASDAADATGSTSAKATEDAQDDPLSSWAASHPSRQSPATSAPRDPHDWKGCVGAAYYDIRHSRIWGLRLLLLGMVSCFPIINWFVSGYAMEWARQCALGSVAPMPEELFTKRNFAAGFRMFVITLVIFLVATLVGSLLGYLSDSAISEFGLVTLSVIIVSFLSAVDVALGLLLSLVCGLMQVRAAMTRRLGEGFSLGKVFSALSGNGGRLFCAIVVPHLVASFVASILSLIVFCLNLAIIAEAVGLDGVVASMLVIRAYAVGFTFVGDAASSVGFDLFFDAVNALATAFIPTLLVAYVSSCILDCVASVLSLRALGWFVARYRPSWVEESVRS